MAPNEGDDTVEGRAPAEGAPAGDTVPSGPSAFDDLVGPSHPSSGRTLGLEDTVGPTTDALPGRPLPSDDTIAFEDDFTSDAVNPLDPMDVPVTVGRYLTTGMLGAGGMAQVYEAQDGGLHRTVALKTLKDTLLGSPLQVRRFVSEAQTMAQLEHPNIVPVHDLGRLPDGRIYFAMKRVQGRTFSEVIASVHAVSEDGEWGTTDDGWSLRRLIHAFQAVCDGCAFAHQRGIVHRDLKPLNIMIGAHNEVLVVDWGLAKVVDGGPETVELPSARMHTPDGTVAGTPAYMPPEQASGNIRDITTRSDVYSLGAVLYEVLTGSPPFLADNPATLILRVLNGTLEPAEVRASHLSLPEDLIDIQRRAMSKDPAGRYADAGELSEEVGAWLDGARLRERADASLARAEATRRKAVPLVERAESLRRGAEERLRALEPHAPESDKVGAWSMEDEAADLLQEADQLRVETWQHLWTSLMAVPTHVGAHEALARRHHRSHLRAEEAGNKERMRALEPLLWTHINALPVDNALRTELTAYMAALGLVALLTVPEGAAVQAQRVRVRNRRLRGDLPITIGTTPLVEYPLAVGSHMLVLRKTGFEPVRYPVHVRRTQTWDTRPPGSSAPAPVPLPVEGALGPDDVFIPGGWFACGGDPSASNASSRRSIWVDGVVMRRHQVTHREYLDFLNDLVGRGDGALALEHVPREHTSGGRPGAAMYDRQGDGGFVPPTDASPTDFDVTWPVSNVCWHDAMAYAAWYARRTGAPWRLPTEMEWEKAARGVDGRLFPWGDALDPSWCCMRLSREGGAHAAGPTEFPVDDSPYGVRGMGGNMRDWCLDPFQRDLPIQDGERAPTPDMERLAASRDVPRVVRGGSWMSFEGNCRSAFRFTASPDFRGPDGSFRLARSWSDSQG